MLGGNVTVTLGLLLFCYTRRDKMEFWSPPLFLAAIYVYYVILGPLLSVLSGATYDRLIDMREFYASGWTGALVGLVSWVIGYIARGGRRDPRPPMPSVMPTDRLRKIGIGLNVSGMTAFLITAGISAIWLINPLAGADEPTGSGGYSGAFANYLALAVNLLIPGCLLLFLLWLRGGGGLWIVGLWTAVAMGIYTSLGFRYRLVLLAAGFSFIYYIERKTRPNLLLLAGVATTFIAVMGFIGNHREYGRGLRIEESQTSFAESLSVGFGETGIFATSGAVIDHVPEATPHALFAPLVQTVLMPVPSALFPGKATNGYLLEAIMTIYGPKNYEGAAYMLFGEWYLAFGWAGVILVYGLLGWACRFLWEWFSVRQSDPMAVVVYGASLPFIYVIMSRGYLPGVTMMFFYTVFPTIALYRWNRSQMPQQPRGVPGLRMPPRFPGRRPPGPRPLRGPARGPAR